MKAKQLGKDLGKLINENPDSVVLSRVEGLLLDNMTPKEKILFIEGLRKTTGRDRLLEILGLVF